MQCGTPHELSGGDVPRVGHRLLGAPPFVTSTR
jgi:hypothetical protein